MNNQSVYRIIEAIALPFKLLCRNYLSFKSRFTKEELKKWWVARCFECGWRGLSKELDSDGPIGMTGCCGDIYCPKCNSTEVDDYSYKAGICLRIKWWWRTISFYSYRKKRREEKEIEKHIKAYEQNLLLHQLEYLPRKEQAAFLAFFGRAKSLVVKYENMDHVFFGKGECEFVDFEYFWLNKLPKIGWIEVEENRRFIAKGAKGKPEAIEYKITVTPKGREVYEAFYNRRRKAVEGT